MKRYPTAGPPAILLLCVVIGAPAWAQGGVANAFITQDPSIAMPLAQRLRDTYRLEAPQYLVINGRPHLQFSYGRFALLPLAELTPPGEEPPTVSIPSEKHVVSKTVAQLPWSAFVHIKDTMTPVKNQGARGTCHVFTATAIVEALWVKREKARGVSDPRLDLSEQWLQFMVKKPTFDWSTTSDGGFVVDDLRMVKSKGHVPETAWKYDPRHWSDDAQYSDLRGNHTESPWPWKIVAQTRSGSAPPSVARAISMRSLGLPSGEDFKVKGIKNGGGGKKGIAFIKSNIDRGVPVGISIPWPTLLMWVDGAIIYVPDEARDKSLGQLRAAELPNGDPEWILGGHAVTAVGYGKPGTAAEGLIAFKNSHSMVAQNDGYGYVTEGYLTKFLSRSVICELDSR